jgi:hypothetical protein
MRIEKINSSLSFGLESTGTRGGFKHVAILFRNGIEVCRETCHYINRTWEAHQFDTVKSCLLSRGSNMTAQECIHVQKHITRL